MGMLFKAFNRLAAYATGGAVGINHPVRFFQAAKLVVKRVVFLVGNGGIVQHVVFVCPFIERIDKLSFFVHKTPVFVIWIKFLLV